MKNKGAMQKAHPKRRVASQSRGLRKRAISEFISYAILIGLAIMLGTLVFKWATGMANDRAADLQNKVYDRDICKQIGLSIQSVCQNPQTLNINLTNTNQVGMTGVLVRMYSIYDDIQPEMREVNASLGPGQSRALTMTKQGTKRRLEVIPLTVKNIACRERMAVAEAVPLC